MSNSPSSASPFMDTTPDVRGAAAFPKVAVSIPLSGAAGIQALVTGPCILMGFGFKESGSINPAAVDLYQDAPQNGNLTLPVTLNPRESRSEWFGPQGIYQSSIVAFVTSGLVSGAIWVVFP